MEKEEKKYVNKAEEDEMVMNSVNLFLYNDRNMLSGFLFEGDILDQEVDCLSLN